MRKSSSEHLKAEGPLQLHTTRLAAEAGLRLLGGLTTSGGDNIRNIDGAYAQTANHRSLLDIAAIGVAAYRVDAQQLHYVAKDDLNIVGLGRWLAAAGTLYIDRKIGLTSANHLAIAERVKQKAAFATWPEGHRYRGVLQKEHIMSLVIVPLIFEHNLTVVPVGIAGTEPGDTGLCHVAYGSAFKPEPVIFEADPAWDHRRRAAKLAQAIRAQHGKEAVAEFMEELYRGMAAAERQAIDCRQERLGRRKFTRAILLPLNRVSGRLFKERAFNLDKG